MPEPWSKSRFRQPGCSRNKRQPHASSALKTADRLRHRHINCGFDALSWSADQARRGRTVIRRIRHTCFALVALLSIGQPPAEAENADLLLVLAADVSRSIDVAKFQLQREGYASAITNPQVLDAIRSGPTGRIAVCFLEWSGVASQRLVIDWTLIGDPESARHFSDGIVEAPRSFADRTSISAGIDFAMEQLERAPFTSKRRAIDVSGDGTNNSGRDAGAARDDAIVKGVTLNGLVILSETPLVWKLVAEIAEVASPAAARRLKARS